MARIINDSQLYVTMFSYNIVAMNDNIVRDTTSPMDAANGVAMLSGFKLNL